MGKRGTPVEEVERLAQRLLTAYPSIRDRNTFDRAYDDYMEVLNENQDNVLRKKVYNEVLAQRPKIKKEKRPDVKKQKEIVKKQTFEKTGKIKNKVVFARQGFVVIKGQRVTTFRDRKGRFVRVIR